MSAGAQLFGFKKIAPQAEDWIDTNFNVPDMTPNVPGVGVGEGGIGKPPETPKEQSPEILAAVEQQRKRLRAARGRSRTILTQGTLLGEPETKRKTILGG